MNEGTGPRLADALILAMREPYLSKLLSGEKTVEVRRTHPTSIYLKKYGTQHFFGCKLYLYRKGQIWGYVTVQNHLLTEGRDLSCLCERYADDACLGVFQMYEYLQPFVQDGAYSQKSRPGILYFVEKPVRYARPVPVPCRPQSWQYMTDSILDLLPDGKDGEQ